MKKFSVFLFLAGCVTFGSPPEKDDWIGSSNFSSGVFVNQIETRSQVRNPTKVLARWFFGSRVGRPIATLPVFKTGRETHRRMPESGLRVTWFGHSSALIEIEKYVVLTDPVWGDINPPAISSFDRFFETPISLDDLPALDAVVISHDHYDHLDIESVMALAETGVPFVVPIGVGSHLRSWDIPESQIVELDWWQVWKKGDLVLTATPARHFSGRGLKQNNTLWSSWSIRGVTKRVYFGGDTGLTEQFNEIGKREGPFDIALIPIGAYDTAWPDVHLNPEQAIQAHKMVRGGVLIPIHWGTFRLALHDWYEPAERLLEAGKTSEVKLAIPLPGQPVDIASVPDIETWWRQP